VDPIRNEIVLQDENLFQIMLYDRTANTPPSATMTEPKRVIGGPATKVEFNCGLYVDPQSGDIYSINNDTLDTMTVFNRSAKGNVPPTRELHTPHRTFGITVDEGAQELFLTVQHPPAVMVYPKMAKGNDAPIRILEGDHTRLEDPHGVAIDTKNKLMFVTNHGSVSYSKDGKSFTLHPAVGGGWDIPGETERRRNMIPGSGKNVSPTITVYPLNAVGDVAPVRIIEGPDTQMDWPAQIYLDEEHGELFVANDVGDSILVFRTTDSGNAKPIRVIKGPKSGIKNPTGVFLDTKNRELVVANMGNHSATVYPRTAQGDAIPLRTIRAAPLGKVALDIGNPGAVAYDSKRDEILVPN
jgi:DNA-binding beta-propeller fold protein YncE